MDTYTFQDRASFSMSVAWTSGDTTHTDHFYVHRLNPWRDLLPGCFLEQGLKLLAQGPVSREFGPGELVRNFDPELVKVIPKDRIHMDFSRIVPGRYYPQGMVSGIPGVFRGNMTPFRCLEKDSRRILGDFNPALAGFSLAVTLSDLKTGQARVERGGACTDWMETALTGPGMQARERSDVAVKPALIPADFKRADEEPDDLFYRQPRFVQHIDTRAVKTLSDWYATLVSPENRVLDLMAGWTSHLPEGFHPAEVFGIGLNERELSANKHLTGFAVQDLNQKFQLDFPDNRFDRVICSLSVEYLTDPVSVFNEVRRILAPDGVFAVAFSNRWFPEKAIALWPDLHEFERLGLVTDLFRAAGGFTDISTVSFRGYPRPVDDRYYPGLRVSDPVFGVTGRKAD
ncbi:MAG: class I SAM-dependent methyltransferase [Desulfobacterales bacterium]|nr:class I SAM-dependent methyltransferase [Desulfobacterales bacterium]